MLEDRRAEASREIARYGGVPLGGVQVAHHDHGADRGAVREDHARRHGAGRRPSVVVVGAIDPDRHAGRAHGDHDPGAHAREAAVPGPAAGHLGLLREPELALVEDLEPLADEQARELTLKPSLAVLADLAVVGEHRRQLLQLEREPLLQGEHVRRGLADARGNALTTLLPAVRAVAGRAVANVESHQPQLRAGGLPLGGGSGVHGGVRGRTARGEGEEEGQGAQHAPRVARSPSGAVRSRSASVPATAYHGARKDQGTTISER